MLIYSALVALSAFRDRLTSTDDDGQGLVEYALILVLVAIVVLIALAALGDTIANGLYKNGVCVISNTLGNAMDGCG